MTAPARRQRRRIAGVCLCLVAAACLAVGTGLAVEEPREEPADTQPPVRVYVGETLDVSAVQLTGGGTVGNETTTFVRSTEDDRFTVDPTDADLDDVREGLYYVERDGDEAPELLVVRPRVTDLDVRNERGGDVADRTVDRNDLDEITVTAEYNFDEADRLDVEVVDPRGSTSRAGGRSPRAAGTSPSTRATRPPEPTASSSRGATWRTGGRRRT